MDTHVPEATPNSEGRPTERLTLPVPILIRHALEGKNWWVVKDIVCDSEDNYHGYRGGHNGHFRCEFSVDPEDSVFSFTTISGVKIPEDKHDVVGSLVLRANHFEGVGALLLDLDEGDISYRCGFRFLDDELTKRMIRNAAMASTQKMDWYLPLILRVMHGVTDPSEELADYDFAWPSGEDDPNDMPEDYDEE